jgi:hypothetical protein
MADPRHSLAEVRRALDRFKVEGDSRRREADEAINKYGPNGVLQISMDAAGEALGFKVYTTAGSVLLVGDPGGMDEMFRTLLKRRE